MARIRKKNKFDSLNYYVLGYSTKNMYNTVARYYYYYYYYYPASGWGARYTFEAES